METLISSALGGFLGVTVAMFLKMIIHHVILTRRELRKEQQCRQQQQS